MQNLSLPNSTAQALLAARVNPSEVRQGMCPWQPCPSASPITPGYSRESTASVPELAQGSGATTEPDPHNVGLSLALWSFA